MAPARVVAVDGGACDVTVGDRVQRVNTLFVDTTDLAPGDWVLMVGDSVMKRLDDEQADAMGHAFGVAFERSEP
jgi:hydrogenase maturation factor